MIWYSAAGGAHGYARVTMGVPEGATASTDGHHQCFFFSQPLVSIIGVVIRS